MTNCKREKKGEIAEVLPTKLIIATRKKRYAD